MDERMARLETAEDVRHLLAVYGAVCDRRDLSAMETILHPDATLTIGDRTWTGRPQVLDFYRSAWAGGSALQRHFITNTDVEQADAVTATASALFLHVTADRDRSVIGWGGYRDSFRRVDGRLLFHHIDIAMDLHTDLVEGWAGFMAGPGR